MKTKVMHIWEYDELERLIEKTYGIDGYSIPCQEECSNDSALTFNNVRGKVADYDESELKDPGSCYLRLLLDDMARKNIIPEGDHVVEISW